MAENENKHGGVSVDHERQLPRLRRIEGQVRGLQQMVSNGRYCVDIAHQIDAVVSALRRVQSDMIRDHLEALIEATLIHDLPEEKRRSMADEIATLASRTP
jgi:DNA-binding FrmR family transcriptional regulator